MHWIKSSGRRSTLKLNDIVFAAFSGLLLIGASKAHAVEQPKPEILAKACASLADRFHLIYDLRKMELDESLVLQIVARDPQVEPIYGYPLAIATKVLYRMGDNIPSLPVWMYGTQLGCMKVIGTDKLVPDFHGSLVYDSRRVEI